LRDEPKGDLARYAFGYSDKKPGWLFWAIHAGMLAFVLWTFWAEAHAAEITCNVVNTMRFCRGPNGWTSTEEQVNGTTFGKDSTGRKWTTHRSNDTEFTTVIPAPEGPQ
jgi:hypothetical protein